MPASDDWRGAVLDSYAVLAYLQDEPGAETVERMLARSRPTEPTLLTWVNLGEVLYIVRREQGPEAADRALAALDQLPLELVAADRALTLEAARLKSRHPVSYADAFCAALAHLTGLPAVTGDLEFRNLEGEVEVIWLQEAVENRSLGPQNTLDGAIRRPRSRP